MDSRGTPRRATQKETDLIHRAKGASGFVTYKGVCSMIRRKSNRRSTRFIEPLERRALLAGNVLAAVTAGNLVVTGDVGDNNIEVQQLANGT